MATSFLRRILQEIPRCDRVGCLDWSMIPGLGASIDAGIPGDFRTSGSLMSWVQIAAEPSTAGESHPTHDPSICLVRCQGVFLDGSSIDRLLQLREDCSSGTASCDLKWEVALSRYYRSLSHRSLASYSSCSPLPERTHCDDLFTPR